MFNVQVLNDAVASLSGEGKKEIQKLVDTFDQYKLEVEKLTDASEGFEQLAIQLSKENIHLKGHIELQAEKITALTTDKADDSIKLGGPINA